MFLTSCCSLSTVANHWQNIWRACANRSAPYEIDIYYSHRAPIKWHLIEIYTINGEEVRTETEVAELHDAMPGQQHVLRLDVPMNDLCTIGAQTLSNSLKILV